MKIENLSGHPAGEACVAFIADFYITSLNGYEYIEEHEEPLCDDEISDGLSGFYVEIKVWHKEDDDLYIGLVRCIDGYEPVCISVEAY